jgi:AcrR family transcriptional regulator
LAARRYTMTRKREATALTRQRILEATLKLHGEKGIFGTSWKDIAQEAGVALGTVYNHFPNLEELVPACGELLMERTQPPEPGAIGDIIGNAKTPRLRLLRVAKTLFAFYQRGGRHLDTDFRERELAAVREWEAYLRSMISGFLAEALSGVKLDAQDIERIGFLLDPPTFRAMRDRGFDVDEAAENVAQLALCWIKHRRRRA